MSATISQVAPGTPLVSDGVALDGLDGSVPSADTSRTTGEQALSVGIPTISDALDGSDGVDGFMCRDGLAALLDDIRDHLATYIGVMDPMELDLLTLWVAHTHVCTDTRTTPRLLLDSTMPGSGKTTTLEHIQRLAHKTVLMSSISSVPLLARLLKDGPVTILIDEVDRSLDEKNPNCAELLAVINSGYKVGATRPTLVPSKDGGWEVNEMSTFGPVAMAGNSPNLPGDTRSRSIRILLMPDVDGTIEDSDWEDIEETTNALGQRLSECMGAVRSGIAESRPELPEGCRGRMREKWRPLMRVADVAGGHWPSSVRYLIDKDLSEVAAELADEATKRPPAVILLDDLHRAWPEEESFLRTSTILERLAAARPDYWGLSSRFGQRITPQRFGRMVSQAGKVHSSKNPMGQRGYWRADFESVWRRTS